MMRLNLQLFWTGISIAYWSGIVSPIVIFQLNHDPSYKDRHLAENKKEQYAMEVMISFGFGEILGGHVQGWFIDKYQSRKAAIFNLLVVVVMTAVTVINIDRERFDWLTYVMSFMWGF